MLIGCILTGLMQGRYGVVSVEFPDEVKRSKYHRVCGIVSPIFFML